MLLNTPCRSKARDIRSQSAAQSAACDRMECDGQPYYYCYYYYYYYYNY